ncbi:hypothetical protein GCM10011376_01180 [Nocardioides flavus (ex Wang et al. 2016)]|uniref:WXG100 family type VII secretion target n=1 Tax=Nocardioides flavus (ex Wang et al. 2016) TaxID=2058780 RepID=A0ABQ3HD64_9ACTN|nr:hypothetical protein [Nocardioides flavus (ex Wang et al. 2016)]GHE15006.1 hypothetical protein GCM10011376_01180 [Nocardioides flavus (ex Wang et al. 2016)]
MGGTLTIDWDNLDSLLGAMVEVGLQSKEIDTYFQEHVVNTVGLDYPSCALKPIGDVLPELGTAFKDARRYYQRRWVEVIHALATSANDLNRVDREIDLDLRAYASGLDAMPDTTISVKLFEPSALTLDDPAEGEPQLKHNQAWETTSDGYDATRDAINAGIDFINGLGAPGVDLPRLPEKSLEDYIVYPLAGNYRLLGTNADSCLNAATAFRDWSLNFGRLALKTQYCLTGSTADSFTAHVGLYGVVMRAVGEAVGQGASVFQAISMTSEKIAVAVENALVKMATKLSKLAAKLSSKLSPIGWLVFAKEVVEKGFGAVSDIYDDIMDCKQIIEACFDLVDTIEAWARAMRDSLAVMEKVRDMVRQLPTTDPDGGLGGMPPVDLPDVEKNLGEITVEITDSSEQDSALDDKLEDLEGQAEEHTDDEDEEEDDDGPVIMAPGPIGEPPYGGDPSTTPMMA